MLEVHQIMKMLEAVLSEKKECAKCLQCDAPAAPGRRGLCKAHYSLYYARLVSIPTKRGRKKYDDNAVALKLILKARPGNRSKNANPFPIPA